MQFWDKVDLNEREANLKTLLMEAFTSYRSLPLFFLSFFSTMQLHPLHHCKLHAGVISVGICQM